MASFPPSKTVPSTPFFILTVKITISPNDLSTFMSHFKPAYDAVLAEPECVFFVVGQNPQSNEGEIEVWWTEGWNPPEDRKNDGDGGVGWFMGVQIKKPYYEPYLKATEPMFVKPRVAEFFVPQQGMCHFKVPTGSGN